MRFVSPLLIAVALGLLGTGSYLYISHARPPQPAPSLVVDPVAFDLGSLPPGEHELVLRVTNPATTTGYVVGTSGGCRANYCYGPKEVRRVEVAPGATVEYRVVVSLVADGPFELAETLYVEENGLRSVPVTARGSCVGAKNAK